MDGSLISLVKDQIKQQNYDLKYNALLNVLYVIPLYNI